MTLKLIAKTNSRRSPPLFSFFASPELLNYIIATLGVAAIGTAVSMTAERFTGVLEGALRRKKKLTDLQEDLLDFLTDSEIVIGPRWPQQPKSYSPSDIRAVRDLIDVVPFSLTPPPEAIVEDKDDPPKLQSSICSFCGMANDFSTWVTEYGEKPKDVEGLDEKLLPKLPYKFNFRLDPKCKNMSNDEIKILKSPPNISIMESDSKRNVYIPRFDRNTGNYVRDYLMMIKMASPHKIGNIQGDKCLIMAGCHGPGTEAGPIALRDEDILKQIWDKVGDGYFQAIFAVAVVNRVPERVRLLQVKPLA